MLVIDVDGTLTDGKIYMGQDGEIFKVFNIKDGYAIHELLPKYNIIPVVITGRISRIVENRARELGIKHIYQGVEDKIEQLRKLVSEINISLANVAYIGDDINDLDCMKNCGFKGCPADAEPKIKKIANFISKKKGGEGAVREFIETIIRKYRKNK